VGGRCPRASACAAKLGVLIGVPAKGEGALTKLWYVLTRVDQAHAVTAVVGLGAVAALLLLKRHMTRLPASLAVLVIAMVGSAVFNLAEHGVAIVGAVTGGLPTLAVPVVTGAEVGALFPAATAMALIAIVETVTAIRKTTDPAADRMSPTREGVGHVYLPPLDQIAYMGGTVTLALIGIIEWPVAAVLTVGHILANNRHHALLRDFGEALDEA
jgi:hypothetical protein